MEGVLPTMGASITGSALDLKFSILGWMPLFSSGLSMFMANKIEPTPAAMLGNMLLFS